MKVRLALALVLIIGLVLALTGVVLADSVRNDVTGSAPTHTIAVGGSLTVNYFIQATGGDGQTGCNASDGTPATVTIVAPANVTASPSFLTFSSCGAAFQQAVVFTSAVRGHYGITHSVTDSGTGTYTTSQANFTLDVLDATAPVVTPNIVGTMGTNGWYTSDVTVSWTTTDPDSGISNVTGGCATTTITSDTAGQTLNCRATNGDGLSTQESVTIKRDATAPLVTASPDRPADYNGWYNAPLVVTYAATDATSGVASCDAPAAYGGPDTASASASGSCTDNAGNTGSATFTFKYDATGPSAVLAVTAGTAGTNSWYTSDVTVSTSGSDDVSGPVTCSADQYQTTETTGAVFNGSCTNDAGLTTDAAPLTVKLDKTGPSANLAVTAGTMGSNGWYTSDVTVSTSGSDDVSGPVTCTPDQQQTTDSASATFNGSCTNDAGLSTSAAPLTIKRDATPPTLTPSVSPNPVVLNGSATASPNASDATSGIASSSCAAVDSSSVGSKSATCNATDNAGNSATVNASYSVIYASSGQCLGAPGHQILQPINADGTSVFKQKSTVPAKFRVCDANGNSIGTPGVVSSFRLVQTIVGTTTTTVNEAVDSSTPDSIFRWSASDQQWIFNINTKNLVANATFFYRISLNDNSTIDFSFGLK